MYSLLWCINRPNSSGCRLVVTLLLRVEVLFTVMYEQAEFSWMPVRVYSALRGEVLFTVVYQQTEFFWAPVHGYSGVEG